MRCRACGAHNGPRAPWCTQCFRPLTVDAPIGPTSTDVSSTDATSTDASSTDATSTGPAPTRSSAADPAARPGPGTEPSADPADREVRLVDDEVEWRCPRCGGWSPLVTARCVACGQVRTGLGERPPPPNLDAAGRRRAAVRDLVVPGLGHLLAGWTGTAVARFLLVVTWLVGGVALARAAASSGAGVLPAVPLLAGVVVVWAGTVVDATMLGTGRQLLRPRVLAVVTAVVLGSLLVAFVVGAPTR